MKSKIMKVVQRRKWMISKPLNDKFGSFWYHGLHWIYRSFMFVSAKHEKSKVAVTDRFKFCKETYRRDKNIWETKFINNV